MSWSSMEPVGFPDYVMNEHGHVQSLNNKRAIKPSYNQHGFPYIQLRDAEGDRKARGILPLVAKMFLDEPLDKNDNTLIRKDGDKRNTHESNLAWRTRSYAIRYHNELREPGLFNYPVYSLDNSTGRHARFLTMREAAIFYGVREEELFNNMTGGTPVYYASDVTIHKN